MYSSDKDGKEKTLNLLHMMDKYFPPDIIPTTDAELDIQIGRIYNQAGNADELQKRLSQVSLRKDIAIETQIYIGQIYINEFQDYDGEN